MGYFVFSRYMVFYYDLSKKILCIRTWLMSRCIAKYMYIEKLK